MTDTTHAPGFPAIDVHQHLWPDELVDRLRARSRPPYLRGWTLHTTADQLVPVQQENAYRHAVERAGRPE